MNKRNLFRLVILSILICVLSVGCAQTDNPGSTAAGTVDNACSLYTPQITEDAFRYLDEIYTEKYPKLGLRWEHGTGADQRIMTAVAQQITQGCATDREKVTAIFNWIVANIRYEEYSSPISSDVLDRECGNCMGKTLLMQDLCRVLGIPAVYSDGIRGDLKTISVEAMQNGQVEGHAWVFVYVEGEWVLYDPTWGTDNVADRTFIAENFYIDKIGGITPVYDENNIPPFNDPVGSFCYLNGRFVTISRGELSNEYSGSFLNLAINVNALSHGKEPLANAGIFYWDGPASFAYVGKAVAELYAGGWVGIGDPGFFWGEIAYAYENGILASEIVMQYNGENYLLHGGRAIKLLMPDDAYRMSNGLLLVDASYTGKIWEPCENIMPEGDYSYQWYSSDESVATVDENGVVTCHGPGYADIEVRITGVGYNGVDEFVWTEDNPIIVSEIVHFSQDISRPAKYAALDPGGPAYVENAPVERMGFQDLYPVMTDDMLMLFEPVDGVLTLPTAQNANGYFILPETYESLLQFPLELRIPLAEGYLTLDRETLESFTLVDTGLWGELWYLPLTEEGANAWGSGSGAAPQPPKDLEFGYPMISTGDIHENYLTEDVLTGLTPENNIIILPPMPEYNAAAFFFGALQMAVDQNCGLEFSFSTGTMVLDAGAVRTLLNGSPENAASLWMIRMEIDWCDYGQQERLKRMAVDGIYYLHAERFEENTQIHDLNGGVATVTVPLNSAGGKHGVFLVDAYGNFTEIPSAVTGDSITFEAPYFATYAVIDTSKTPVK